LPVARTTDTASARHNEQTRTFSFTERLFVAVNQLRVESASAKFQIADVRCGKTHSLRDCPKRYIVLLSQRPHSLTRAPWIKN
jgi:hypothetical protein